MKWQQQNQQILSLGNTIFPTNTLFPTGRRYLSNYHNWGGYGATFGLKEEKSLLVYTNNGDPEIPAFYPGYVETGLPKNAVISFSYPIQNDNNERNRLVFEKIETDTFGNNPDNPVELMTLNSAGNLGINTATPSEKLDVLGNFKLTGNQNNLGDFNLSGNQNSTGNLTLTGNQSIIGEFSINQNNNSIMNVQNESIFLDKLKPNTFTDGYLRIDNTGKLYVVDAAVSSGANWKVGGNNNSTITNSGAFFGHDVNTTKDIVFIQKGSAFGAIYSDFNNRGRFTWSAPVAFGGWANTNYLSFPRGLDNVPLTLYALKMETASNIVYDQFVGIHSSNIPSFKLSTTGRIKLGSCLSPSINQYSGVINIGDYIGFTPPAWSIVHETTSGFYYGFANNASYFKLGNSVFDNANGGAGNVMTWDGDINPYTGGNRDLGKLTSNEWRNGYFVNQIVGTSDIRFKKEIKLIDNALQTISKIEPITFKWSEKIDNQLHYGFSAQQLQTIFPNAIVVGNSDSGKLGVRYGEIIPILTKAIQEQQKIIENQAEEINMIKKSLQQTNIVELSSNNNNISLNKTPILFQNTPNPSNGKTFIDFFIPNEVTQAAITVTDNLGKIIYSASINKVGMGRVLLDDLDLAQGNYFYTLFVNGKIIDTKQMVIIKN